MTYHYWISRRSGQCVNVYNLETEGIDVMVSQKLYKSEGKKSTNSFLSLVEMKVVADMGICERFKKVELSSRCRILYNSDTCILEMDGKSLKLAERIFSTIANNKESLVFFDVDESLLL